MSPQGPSKSCCSVGVPCFEARSKTCAPVTIHLGITARSQRLGVALGTNISVPLSGDDPLSTGEWTQKTLGKAWEEAMLGVLMGLVQRWSFGKVEMAPEVCSPASSTKMGSLHLPGFGVQSGNTILNLSYMQVFCILETLTKTLQGPNSSLCF